MGFFSLIGSIFSKLAKKSQDLMKWLWGLAQDADGKIKGVNPSKIPKIISLIGIVSLLILLVIQMTKPEPKTTNGAAEFEKEITPSSSTEYRYDPSAIDPLLNNKINGGSIDSMQSKIIDNIGTSTNDSGVLSVSDCLDVINKMKLGTTLTPSESDLANKCIAENPMGLTGDELKLAQKLLDPTLTAEERKFLTQALNGELTPEQRDLALALAGNDPEKAALAKAAINSGNQDVINAAAKQLAGKELTEDEKNLLANLKTTPSKSGNIDTALGENKSTPIVGTISESGATPEAVKDLSLGIADRDKDIKNQQQEVERAKKDAQDVAAKIQSGAELGDSEVKRLQNLTQKQKDLDALIKKQEQDKKDLADKLAKMKETISRSMITVGGKNIPTGVFVEYEGEEQCSPKAKPFVKAVKPKDKKSYVDLDNRPLNPEEVEFIKLMRKGGKTEIANSGDSFNKNLGEPMLVATNGEVTVDTAQMIVFADKGVKDCELTADMMIPAQIDSDILVSSNGSAQQVRMKILQDVYCPTNNQQLLIGKGAIAIANAGSFDADTGVMNMTINKVTSGGKNLSFSFSVASANGMAGLRGEVRDTTGKYLLGAFIPAFAGAALSYFSSQQVQPYLQSTQAAQAMTGAALAGSAEVMNKIAELAASKMLNAPKLFWVPKGIPVVLIPN
jgi:hypothetical protein